MSRQVPVDRPLSEEDREYLLTRGRDSLVARLDAAFSAEEETEGDAEPGDVEPGAEVDDEGDADEAEPETAEAVPAEVSDLYDKMTAEELREECRARDLSSKGNKTALVARLREDDAGEE